MNTKSYSLILGGTRGLGREIYQQISASGRPCFLVARGEVDILHPADRFLKCDFASEASVRSLLAQLNEQMEDGACIDVFYWVSGLLEREPYKSIAPESILRMIDVNLRNPLLVAQWVWARFQNAPMPSSFVVISSTAGISESPRDDEAVYAATKAAQVSFARAIGKNNSSTQCRISLFCPGGMKTPFWEKNPIDRATYESFMDPRRVAQKIVTTVREQNISYLEVVIPRGSL